MPDIRYIDKDFATFAPSRVRGHLQKALLAFGDQVEVLEEGTGGGEKNNRIIREISRFG
jgi:hypothetical protein